MEWRRSGNCRGAWRGRGLRRIHMQSRRMERPLGKSPSSLAPLYLPSSQPHLREIPDYMETQRDRERPPKLSSEGMAR